MYNYLDQNLDVNIVPLGTTTAFLIPECMIGDSGVIISATGIEPSLSNGQLRLGELSIKLPKDISVAPDDLVVRNATIGEHGFSGEVGAAWELKYDKTHQDNDGLIGKAVGSLFDVFSFGMRQVSITFDRNIPQEFDVQGLIVIPALDNGAMEAVVSLGVGGEIMVGLVGVGEEGLVKLTKDQLFDLQVNAVEFSHTAEETGLTVSGDFQLTNPEVKEIIPKFGVQGFTIYKPRDDNDWAFRLEGGSIEINKSIDLFGVARADIKEIGMGERDGWNVFTFSGGVQLLEGVDAGVWVEGLRIPWRENPNAEPRIEVRKLTLDGIGLLVVVPDSFEFMGAAAKKEEGDTSYFEGGISLTLLPVEMGLSAFLKVGSNPNCRFAFISANFCLPGPGIQLGCLPLYIRCLGGLMGVNTTPDADTIYDYFPLAQRQPAGLMYPSKWRDQCGTNAIGLSVSIATANPKMFNMEALLAFVYPELLLLIEGKAFILKNPKPGQKPPFHSFMAFDIDQPAALINVSAQYEFIKGVLSVDGTSEIYYGPDPQNPSHTTSYLALGKVQPYFPVDKPVKAKVLQIFDATSYLILKPGVWALGSSIGLPKKSYNFSVASVNFEALIEGEGELKWGPEQFKGSLDLTGNVGFRIFKKGFDLWLNANVLGMTPDWLIDALLKFGIKFKFLWKKVKFKAEIPFHWEKRVTPPIPELLNEIILRHPVTGASVSPYILTSSDSVPAREDIPEVEPASYPALAFNFPMNDRTGLPFGQDVSSYLTHRSGDYTFTAELPGDEPGGRGIAMHRMPRDEFPGGVWKEFTNGRSVTEISGSDEEAPPVLYGAWQATQAPDGTGGRTHLHLFAQTPFDFNRPNRLKVSRAAIMYDQVHIISESGTVTIALKGSTESQEAIKNAARSMLSDDDDLRSAIKVPVSDAQLKSFEDLRVNGRPLPLGGAQFVANEQPSYPRSLNVGTTKRCHNFLTTDPRFYGLFELIYLGGEEPPSDPPANWEPSTDVLLGGFGYFQLSARDRTPVPLGNCEIVIDDSLPHPLRLLRLHDSRGADQSGEIISGELRTDLVGNARSGIFKIILRYPVRRLEIHYEGMSTSRYKDIAANMKEPSLKFLGAFSRPFTADSFWQFSNLVKPQPQVDTSETGEIVITTTANAPPFNEVVFVVSGDTRIFSLCYEVDPTQELADKEQQLKGFIDVTWPNSGDGLEPAPDGDEDRGRIGVGPMSLNDPKMLATLEGSIVPGYVYKLVVRTSHQMSGGQSGGTREDTYSAFWQVPKPPSDLAPYVVTTFPKDTGFPHYRASEYYLRCNRNYVHKLMGGEDNKLTWKIPKDSEPITGLPFRDGQHADLIQEDPETGLTRFQQNTDHDRKGWGWGKANGHVLTREEEIWKEAYNRSVPAGEQISDDMIIPDDMIWVYQMNPVLLRDDFSQGPDTDNGTETTPHFQNPVSEGLPLGGEWVVKNALLCHKPAEISGLEPSTTMPISESFLLTKRTFEAPYLLSVWFQPQVDIIGHVGIVVAANQSLSRHLLISLDPTTQRVRLIRKDNARDPADRIRTLADKPIGLGRGRWSRLFVRVAPVSGQLAVTLEFAGQTLFSEISDLPSDLPSDEQHAGLLASADYTGKFDNFEVLSIDRLNELPLPGATQHLALYYNDQGQSVEMYKKQFLASQYLDLFDHLNAWDRNVWPASGDASDDDSTILPAVGEWKTENEALLTALANLADDEQQYAAKLRTLEDLEATKKGLREARFNLDEKFEEVADILGFDLAVRPERFEFILAKNGKGLLIQSPEPIDWTRLSADPVNLVSKNPDGSVETTSIRTQLIYRSDLTRAILLLRPDEDDFAIRAFVGGQTYVWTLGQNNILPPHLDWLQGWVDHRKEKHRLTLEMPNQTPQ